MTDKLISQLSLAIFLAACAHQGAKSEVQSPQHAQQAEGKRRSSDENAERVEVPRKRDRGELASAHGAPGREPQQREATANDGQEQTNEEHANEAPPTAGQQGNGEIDLDLTQRIRKAVMRDDNLSFTAKNAKIISRDGHVTLRGRVKSGTERDVIYQTALREAGAGHVTNALEVDEE